MNTKIMKAYEESKKWKGQMSIEEYCHVEKCPNCGNDNYRVDAQLNFDIYICKVCRERYDVKR